MSYLDKRPASDVGSRTLPQSFYTDARWYQRELEHIHYKMWLYAGRTERLSQPGDYFLFELGQASVIVLRDEAGQLRAFHNVCRHRGTRLCSEAQGRFAARIQCPYHAWTYRLDGSLAQAPHMEKVAGFRPADHPLGQVHVGEWAGHLFLHFGAQPPPLSQHLAGLDTRFANWPMADMRVACQKTYQLRANWKLVIQNYHECLHCPTAHPQLNRQSHYLSGENEPPQPTYLGARMELRPGFVTLSNSAEPTRAPFPALTPEQRRNVYYYAILPNFLLNLHPDYVVTFRFNPRAVDATEIVCEWLFHRHEMARPGFDPADAVDFWDLTNRQDWALSDAAQAGIASLGYQPGPYSNREELLVALDRWVLARVGQPEAGT
jgi:Rieske 2Fe-2S family protein